MREKLSLNHGWRFLANPPAPPVVKNKAGMYLSAKTERLKWGPGGYRHNDVPGFWSSTDELHNEPWENVDLPHDYIIRQAPCPDEAGALGFFKYFPAWYRRHFKLSPEDQNKRLTIYFEGITGIADIYLNGCFLKHNEGSYVSFEVEITDLARFDQENVLAIYVNPESYEGWWYAGGGIYRDVWLVKTDTVAVDLWGVFVPVKKQDKQRWQVPVEVALKNIGYEDETVEALCEIFSPEQDKVGELTLSGTARARGVTTLTGASTVVSPRLWDLDTPKQYELKVTVSKAIDGTLTPCDVYEQRFGFREIIITPEEGLFLNGRNVKIKGVCAHLDFGLTGKAVPGNICRYKVGLYKEMGANAFRASHYPHQEATMDACDELGILVMNETRRFESNDDAIAQMEMLVKRDRNRPSVFLWSTGNEEIYHGLPQGHRIHKALAHVVRQLDPTRPVTTAITNLNTASVHGECDIVGANYSLRVLDEAHDQFAEKPFISSENCAVASTRGWYYGNSAERGLMDARDYDPGDGSFQVFGREKTWRFIMERPWLAGGFQWDAIEHRGEAVWPRLSSVSGAIDLFLQKKDAFYQNQSHWLETPMLHILPHWTHHGLDDLPIKVWVYTNCEEVELFLNGTSLGKQAVEKWGHAEWPVSYQPGTLEAIGYLNGKRQVTDIRETTGPATALKLQLENAPVYANGDDIALFTCLAVDELGREVPDASPTVHFDCTGFGRIVGTGSSNTDHVPVPSPERQMHAGRISVAVKLDHLPAGADSAEISLFARANSLKGAFFSTDIRAETEGVGK